MFRLVVTGIGIVGVLVSLVFGLFMVVSWEVSGILVTAFIGIPSLVLVYLSSREKKTGAKGLEKGPRKQPRQSRTILEETCVVDGEGYVFYDLDLKKGEEVRGEVSSDEAINFFFLTKHSLNSFENKRDFNYEYGSENLLKRKIHFSSPKTRTWYLVIENEGDEPATVDIHLFV